MHDFYPTPPYHTRQVLGYLDRSMPVWDPAAGNGTMLDVIEAHGFAVVGSDLVDYGRGYVEQDFLEADPIEGVVAQIVTNPPFKHAQAFAEHALVDLKAPLVALLLPSHYLGGQARATFFREHPPWRVGIVPARMRLYNGNVSQFYHAWFVWQRWIHRDDCRTKLEWLGIL